MELPWDIHGMVVLPSESHMGLPRDCGARIESHGTVIVPPRDLDETSSMSRGSPMALSKKTKRTSPPSWHVSAA